ncbi:hypothetical protein CRG98_000228 [Punica granatum]|uniref:Uncharacterized protein n=1 Tax=Punica granatum TaxID=22663 RepID=A0A2I0LFB8_PUNGR|nr:hypothetical protein CRG98_000228 [Punica granatum]
MPATAIGVFFQVLCGDAPTLLELSTMEMTEDQGFEAYVVKWRARAAKHPLKPMPHLRCIINNNSQRSKFTIPPRQLPFRRRSGSNTPIIMLLLLLRFNKVGPRLQEPLSRCNGLRLRRTNRASQHKRGVNSSHPCRLRSPTYTGNSLQDQSRCCEYHQGAPGHPTDNCWKLREKIQQMIDDKQLTFNAVKPPNVQSNPLPDHGLSSGPSINMISVCAIGEYETGQEAPASFVIEYIPVEIGAGYVGFDATPAPFVIEVPAREPYQDSKAANKGKALAVPKVAPEASSIPQKKVIEEKAEAFMKIIMASEYKDGRVPKIEESLRRLENRQLTAVELTEEINVGTEKEPRILKIGMIEFLTDYQEVFAWSYVDMPSLDPSIVKHFLPLDTERFPPKR